MLFHPGVNQLFSLLQLLRVQMRFSVHFRCAALVGILFTPLSGGLLLRPQLTPEDIPACAVSLLCLRRSGVDTKAESQEADGREG